MNISLKSYLPVVAAGLLTLSACENTTKRAEQYMQNHTYSEFTELTNTISNSLIQSRLDSLAYRDIFNGTQASKDSALVAEFNKIASSVRGYENSSHTPIINRNIEKKLTANNITTKDMNDIKEKSFDWAGSILPITFQHYADDWAYRKFFEKAGIMNDSIAAKCDEVSKQIRP